MTGEHSASRSVETLREEAPHLIAEPDTAAEWLRKADEEIAAVAHALFSRTESRRRGQREELGHRLHAARAKILSVRLDLKGSS